MSEQGRERNSECVWERKSAGESKGMNKGESEGKNESNWQEMVKVNGSEKRGVR